MTLKKQSLNRKSKKRGVLRLVKVKLQTSKKAGHDSPAIDNLYEFKLELVFAWILIYIHQKTGLIITLESRFFFNNSEVIKGPDKAQSIGQIIH